MADLLSFALLSFSSIIIVVNPLAATLLFVSLTATMDRTTKLKIARDSSEFALVILLIFTFAGGWILQLFGISIEAFRIAGGLLLFGIGMDMVYAKTSRAQMTATEKYEGQDADDIAVMPLAIPMIAGPGAITSVIVLMNEAAGLGIAAIAVVPVAAATASDHLLHDAALRDHRPAYRPAGVPRRQPPDGDAPHRDRGPVHHHRAPDSLPCPHHRSCMNHDLTFVGIERVPVLAARLCCRIRHRETLLSARALESR